MIFYYILIILALAFFGCGIGAFTEARGYYKRMNKQYDRVYADIDETNTPERRK